MSFINPYRFSTGGGGGFRYMHDEISGGVFAYSHLKVKSSYSGSAVRVNLTDYDFISGLTPLSTIQSDEPTRQDVIYYEQINGFDASTNPITGAWDGTDYCEEVCTASGLAGFSLDLNQAKTIIIVANLLTDGAGTTQGLVNMGNSTTLAQTFVYAGSNNLFLRKLNGGNATSQYAGVRNTGTHLYVWSDNGSLDTSGDSLYYDDMVTPRAKASSSGSISNATMSSAIEMMKWSGNNTNIDGYVLEYHCFNKVLSQSERETAKEILEQYYTFS